jgi:hypothetical protein
LVLYIRSLRQVFFSFPLPMLARIDGSLRRPAETGASIQGRRKH